LPLRLSQVDELIRPDHFYLAEGDECYFIGEYSARQGYAYSATNQLIFNLKKKPHLRGTPQWPHKLEAIRTAARQFAKCISAEWLHKATLVPMPPSRVKGDPGYDDRVYRILREIGTLLDGNVDVRELLIQNESIEPFHERGGGRRPTPEEIAENYHLDDTLRNPPPSIIGIFDDVLTTGSHFKGAKLVLEDAFPGTRIVGVFLARRVPETVDVEDLFMNLDG